MTNRVVYYTNEGFVNEDGSYQIILAEENEPGYTPSKFSHESIQGARELVDQLNRELGYTEEDMMDVVSSSMAAQNRQTGVPERKIPDLFIPDYDEAKHVLDEVVDEMWRNAENGDAHTAEDFAADVVEQLIRVYGLIPTAHLG